MISPYSDEVLNIFDSGFDSDTKLSEIKRGKLFVFDTPVTVSIVTLCDIRVLVERIGDKWMFPSSHFIPKKETVQQTASRVLSNVTEVEIDSKKWIPVDVRSHPDRKDMKSGKFSVDIGWASILELSDVPLVDTKTFSWALVDFDNGKFPLPLIEDHRQLWEAAFGIFNLLLKP